MTIRLGLVGCGRISHAHGIAVRRLGPDVARIVACCDLRKESADSFAAEYGCDAAYGDPAQMYAAGGFDAVVMATWPAQHLEQIRQAIKAGVRFILCEKALATTSDDAMRIWQLARDSGTIIVEGFMYLHHPLILKLEELMADGRMGEIDWIRSASSYHFPEVAPSDDPTRSWRFRKETGGGVPWDLACYTVNAVTRYAGQLPVSVMANGSRSPNYGTVNRMFGTIAFEGGRTGVIEGSAVGMFNQELEIHGADRVMHIETVFTPPGDNVIREKRVLKPSHIEVTEHLVKSPIPLQDDLPAYYCYQAQMVEFLKVVHGNAMPKPTLSQSVVNTFVIEAMIRSIDEDQRVNVKLPDELIEAWRKEPQH